MQGHATHHINPQLYNGRGSFCIARYQLYFHTEDYLTISDYSIVFLTCKFFFLWNTMLFALTFLSLMSTLFPQRTMGMFSHTRTRSRCQFGTFLYVTRDVTSNITTAHCPWNKMHNQVMKPYSHKMWPNWSWFYCFQWCLTHPVGGM